MPLAGGLLGKRLCARSALLLAKGDAVGARDALDEASGLASEMGVGPQSPLRQEI